MLAASRRHSAPSNLRPSPSASAGNVLFRRRSSAVRAAWRLACLCSIFTLSAPAWAQPEGSPLLYREVEIPEPLLGEITTREGRTVRFGGDVRIGDLTGNGRADLLVFRSTDGGMKPCFLGAFTLDGEVLWSVGKDGEQPNRPGPVAIHHFDDDEQAEVVCLFTDGLGQGSWLELSHAVLQVRDGATGRIEREATPGAFQQIRAAGQHREWNAPNWVHQRILIANLRGTPTPRDFVIKLGLHVLAFDDDLEPLWHYEIPARWKRYGRHTAYIPAVGDIDEDGRDEVLGGYYLLDDDGRVRWEKELGPHMDSVAIAEWDQGRTRAICSGHGHVLDEDGNVLLRLGGELVPHGQEVRVADFLSDVPGPEMAIRYNGHSTGVRIVSNDGEVRHRFDLNENSNNTGMEAVFFHGRDRPALLYNGGMLWMARGEPAARMPDLPPAVPPVKPRERPGWRMAWYHCIPADVCGDPREDLLLYNPWETAVLIYTAAPFQESAYRGYRPGRRQYNPRLMD